MVPISILPRKRCDFRQVASFLPSVKWGWQWLSNELLNKINKIISVEHLAWCLAVSVPKKMGISIHYLCDPRKTLAPWAWVSSSLEGGARKWKITSSMLRELQLTWPGAGPQSPSGQLYGGTRQLGLRDTAHWPQPGVWQLLPSGKAIWQCGKRIHESRRFNPGQSKERLRQDLENEMWFPLFLVSGQEMRRATKLSLVSRDVCRITCLFRNAILTDVSVKESEPQGLNFCWNTHVFGERKKKNRALDPENAKLLGNCSKPDTEGIRCHPPFRASLVL